MLAGVPAQCGAGGSLVLSAAATFCQASAVAVAAHIRRASSTAASSSAAAAAELAQTASVELPTPSAAEPPTSLPAFAASMQPHLLATLGEVVAQKGRERAAANEAQFIDANTFEGFTVSGLPGGGRVARADALSQGGGAAEHALRVRQFELEQRAINAAVAEYQAEIESAASRGDAASMSRPKRLMQKWFEPLRDAIKEAQDQIADGNVVKGVQPTVFEVGKFGPYFLLLNPEQLSVLTMHSLIGQMLQQPLKDGVGRVRTTVATIEVGRAVMAQVNLLKLKKSVDDENRRIAELNRIAKAQSEVQLAEWDARAAQEVEPFAKKIRMLRNHWQTGSWRPDEVRKHAKVALGDDCASWGNETLTKLGAFLVSLFMQTATMKVKTGRHTREEVPVLSHEVEIQEPSESYGRRAGVTNKVGFIVAAEEAMRSMLDPEELRRGVMPKYLPMLVRPLPWTGFNSGGYLTLRCTAVRTRGGALQVAMLRSLDHMASQDPDFEGVSRVYRALTVLGEQGWSINHSVQDVVEALWATGGAVAGLPSAVQLPKPDPPDQNAHSYLRSDRIVNTQVPVWKRDHDTGNLSELSVPGSGTLTVYDRGPTPAEESEYRRALGRRNKIAREQHSLMCHTELNLQVAREFAVEKCFHYPHNMDFRGRAYPLHPHLTHLAGDMCRGLLQFSEERPLGPKGLFWLKVHATNLYARGGVDKRSLTGRAEFIDENMGKVIDSAKDPLSGDRWWLEAEKPFQFLATCMEIRNAVESANPETYRSALPVHQDGSCNGLQHYAALGRDSWGGASVNLTPADVPQDVYTGVASIVKAKVEADLKDGVPEAILLSSVVDRKLVKQTVMTSVYGVTFVGARDQIASRLRERGWTDEENIRQCSFYAAKCCLAALGDMFANANNIKKWLADCASIIAKTGKPVQWTTPMGLPVVQPYRATRAVAVRTVLQSLVIQSSDEKLPVQKARQRSAFPPNYIHSIDSTHMMLTALACAEHGLAFAGVHDSFWTHASSVDQMNALLREEFYNLHSRPLLQDLYDQIVQRYPEIVDELPPVPDQGDLDLAAIHKAVYFFS